MENNFYIFYIFPNMIGIGQKKFQKNNIYYKNNL